MPDFSAYKTHIDQLVRAALDAADPTKALARHWSLDDSGPVYLVGAGKASLEMAVKAFELCGERIADSAIAVVPQRLEQAELPAGLNAYPANHPLPDERNIKAAQQIAQVAKAASQVEGAALVVLISGGGSAHLTLPSGDLTLDDLRHITSAVMNAGAPIQELNAVRKHCEQLKGGGLAKLASPAKVHSFILSDVMGDPLDVIASGPTAVDPSTYADALAVLDKYNLRGELPAIGAHLEAGMHGEHPETLKEGDLPDGTTTHTIVGNNVLALEAVRAEAESLGFTVLGVGSEVEGEASEVGRQLAENTAAIPEEKRPACYLLGGETTVTVRGDGKGGRNQEMALSAAIAFSGRANVAAACFGTDGIDGPTDAAGAIVTGGTVPAAKERGLDADKYLLNNDSYTLFKQLNTLIKTGPTGTNVNDISIGLAY